MLAQQQVEAAKEQAKETNHHKELESQLAQILADFGTAAIKEKTSMLTLPQSKHVAKEEARESSRRQTGHGLSKADPSAATATGLSLIHISEPTRPY